ncbi:MAG: hypothetical protein JOY90_38685 [Bradyrhizobium sp.]|uniref:hypothetical protein n=1 Tax=Bradyrhizobium sp. TaxID=376 RepID=UPI001D2940F4|nr:hypothetical protein [Bradyrhizobium sp.]MBV9566329.1 hypothetical protein [Bradyrhizobium sp.]
MSLSAVTSAEADRARRAPLPLWVGVAVYVLLVVAGNHLLIDPDSLWQVTVGQWIIDHRAVPESDVYSFTMAGQPWISTQWLAQVLYAEAYGLAGWSGVVVLAASGVATTFALLANILARRLNATATLVCLSTALALMMPHLLARAHVLAMPFLVLWIGGLIEAADRRTAPSLSLLPWMALWANLHGGFVFGLFFIAPAALDALVSAEASVRRGLALRWAAFGLAALLAACCTPYGWNAILASQKILALGGALPLIMEWRPMDFGSVGPFEICLLLGTGLALQRGVTLPPVRILMLLGLLHMALSQGRAAEVLALVAPMILAAPLARQIAGSEAAAPHPSAPRRSVLYACAAIVLMAGTAAYGAVARFAPNLHGSPVRAVIELKKLHVDHVFNDYDFGGYLIANGVPTFIDGRTELFGEKFFVDHNAASGLMEPENLFRLLDAYAIDATLLRTQSPATKLLDHMDGWQKIYADDIATIHLRKPDAMHTSGPLVQPTARADH